MKKSDFFVSLVQTLLFVLGIVSSFWGWLFFFFDSDDKWFSRLTGGTLCLGVHYILKILREKK